MVLEELELSVLDGADEELFVFPSFPSDMVRWKRGWEKVLNNEKELQTRSEFRSIVHNVRLIHQGRTHDDIQKSKQNRSA